jgi:hypothetical protein
MVQEFLPYRYAIGRKHSEQDDYAKAMKGQRHFKDGTF